MKGLFEVASGTVIGRHHSTVGKNNQDSYYSYAQEGFTLGVVCDGCGSGCHSEVGAQLGVRLVGQALAQQLQHNQSVNWEELREFILQQIRCISETLAITNSLGQILREYFFFTIVGVVITPTDTTIFSLGDGVIALNGNIKEIGPFPDNAPPYITDELLEGSKGINFNIEFQLPTDKVESIMIGTDGVADLMNAEKYTIAGKTEKVGNIAQFWQDDRYFNNPDMLRRKLSLINRQIVHPDWFNKQLIKQGGFLSDDTTLIVIRRKSLA